MRPVCLLAASISRYTPAGNAKFAIFQIEDALSVQSRTALGISNTTTIHNAMHLVAEIIESMISRIGFISPEIIPLTIYCCICDDQLMASEPDTAYMGVCGSRVCKARLHFKHPFMSESFI